ncbi:MAG: NifB/NifX family molybdenum-iron cluster-binding protein [Bacteroidota bacterium]|nr:NifB/NifX family molybdenum-iron cluster-binding protein [Bacteroidota bacterium]
MSYRIAIASNDGVLVDQHFGQAENFLVYEVSDGNAEFVEDREVPHFEDEIGHSEANLERIANLLSDCKVVFVQRIGKRAERHLLLNGIKSFAVDFSVNHILTTLLKRQNGRVKLF